MLPYFFKLYICVIVSYYQRLEIKIFFGKSISKVPFYGELQKTQTVVAFSVTVSSAGRSLLSDSQLNVRLRE